MPGNPLDIGSIVGSSRPLILSQDARRRHMYVCGGTGVGKSKFLEYCVRQDILNWPRSHSGLLLLDPHGLVYKNTMAWLARHNLKRPVVPIDLRRKDWIISYNLLRKREGIDPAVIVENFVQALAHVWGADGTDQTPLFARWATVILLTLYQSGSTIADMVHLLSRVDVRRAMSARVKDPTARQAWQFAERNPKEFEQQVTSTLNRFPRLLGPEVMQATFGQADVSLDLHTALEEGQIILVNLSTEGGQIGDENADTFATLLLADLWAAAKGRGKVEEDKTRPYYVYVDECQNFITPTIAKNLDQARGYGLNMILAHQFPSQLSNQGIQGKALYDSIMGNASTKIVFRTEHYDDVEALAKWMFLNTLDPDQVKLTLRSTKVMGYREEVRETYSESTGESHSRSTGRGGGQFRGASSGSGEAASETFNPDDSLHEPLSSAEGWNNSMTDSSGDSESWSEADSEGTSHNQTMSYSSVLLPIMGQETSSVQFRTIEEQLFFGIRKLFGQKDRHFAVRFPGGPSVPLFVKTPNVPPATTQAKRVEAFRQQLLNKLPFAMPLKDALERYKVHEQHLLTAMPLIPVDEATTAKRKIKPA